MGRLGRKGRRGGGGVSQGQTDSLKITGAVEDANEVMRR